MTTSAAFALSLLAIASLLVVLGVAIVAARAGRQRSIARRHAVVAPLRPALLRMLAADDPDERNALLHELLAIERRLGRVCARGALQGHGRRGGRASKAPRCLCRRSRRRLCRRRQDR